eukprot:10962647-Alexandrium_andersonii.AAC.1
MHGEALVSPAWWDEATYARAAAVFQDVLGDVHYCVAHTSVDRLLPHMQAEVQRYQFAVLRPDWFAMLGLSLIHISEPTRLALI